MTSKNMSKEEKFNFVAKNNSDNPKPLDLVTDTVYKARYYQTNAVLNVVDYLNVGFRRILVVSPTGSGKTMIARMLATSREMRNSIGFKGCRKFRVLFLAHEYMLLQQAKNIFSDCPDIELITHSSFMNISDELMENGWDVTFIDEGHHEPMFSVQKLLDKLSVRPIIGLTATPKRGDGLMPKFERYVFAISKEKAVQRKFISCPDINSIIDTGGQSKIDIAIDLFEQYGHEMGQSLVYFRTKKECQQFTDYLISRGYAARFLHDNKTMFEIIEQFENFEIQFITNCQKLGEGTDIRGCTDVYLCRQFNSEGEKEQYIGRSIRIDSKSVVWEFVNPFTNNKLTKDLFPVYGKHRLIYKESDENNNFIWHEDILADNGDEIYDHEYLENA